MSASSGAKKHPGSGLRYQSLVTRNNSRSLSTSHQVFPSVSFRQHVQISTAARFARSSAQRDCFQAIPDHCATSQNLQELEELGREMDIGWRSYLLLQHFERFR